MSAEKDDVFPEEIFAACADSAAAITRGEYEDALIALDNGIKKAENWTEPLNGQQLARHIQMVLLVLARTLREAYGERWTEKTDIPKLQKINEEDLQCSFCGKKKTEVKQLIAGPKVFICNKCVALCVGILREKGIEPI